MGSVKCDFNARWRVVDTVGVVARTAAISSSVGAKLLEASDIGISPFAQNVAQVQGQVNGFTCGDKRTFGLGPFGQLAVEEGDGFLCGGRGRGHAYILTKGLCGALVAGRIRPLKVDCKRLQPENPEAPTSDSAYIRYFRVFSLYLLQLVLTYVI